MALVRRDYFDDALAVYEMTARAAGGDIADVERWLQMKSRDSKTANGSNTEASKKRRRRRGGRRRRRTSSDAGDDLDATSLPIN